MLGAAFWSSPSIASADLSAGEVMAKAYVVSGGDDSVSRLTFTFHKADGKEKKLVYTMAWKKYGPQDEIRDKVIFFSEYPPDDNGKSYMIWVAADRRKQDDEWMYLPELRMVRKVTHDLSRRHDDKQDDFSHSLLTQVNLMPRDPDLDTHILLQDDQWDGHADYVVESVPKQANKTYPYAKTRRWISKDNFLTERIDYYNESGEVEMRQTTRWKKIGNAWVWEQVAGENPPSSERTVLDISDIRINNHLRDEVFSKRTMRLGKDSLTQ